jgi:hypothetical protein
MELNLFDGQKDLSEKEIKERYNSHMLAYLVSDYSTSLREIDDNFLEDLDVNEVVSEENENELKDIIEGELTKVANTDLLDFFTGEVGKKLIKAGLIETEEDLQYRKTLSERFGNKEILEGFTVSNLTDSFIRGKLFGVERVADSEKEVEEGELRNAILNNNLKETYPEFKHPFNPLTLEDEMNRKYPVKSSQTADEKEERLPTKSITTKIFDTHEQITELYDKANIGYTVEKETSEISQKALFSKTSSFVEGSNRNPGSMLDKIYKSDLNATHISANYDDNGRLIYDTFRTFRLEIGENAKTEKVTLQVINYTITPNIGRTRVKVTPKELRVRQGSGDIQKDLQEVLNVISRNYSTLNNEVRRI